MGRHSDTDCFNVRDDLGAVLIFSIPHFAIGVKIDHSPAREFSRALLKGQIDHALNQCAIIAIMLKGGWRLFRTYLKITGCCRSAIKVE